MDEHRHFTGLRMPSLGSAQNGLGGRQVIAVRNIYDDVCFGRFVLEDLEVLLRSNDRCDGRILGRDEISFLLLTDKRVDFELRRLGVRKEACQDGTTDVACELSCISSRRR